MDRMEFAQNSDTGHGCPHSVLRYIVDGGWHTIDCNRCHKRWSLMKPGVLPRYTAEGPEFGMPTLLNPAPPDPAYPIDKCVDP